MEEETTNDTQGEIASDPSKNPVTNFIHDEVSVTSTNKSNDDTIVDVHVNNPLKKITQLLEEIKKQKAFSFSIKGSLGAAGVVLMLTAFGIFGGTKAFCSKGEQSHIGIIVVLGVQEDPDNSWMVRAQTIWNAMTGKENKQEDLSRIVLIEQTHVIYRLIGLSGQKNLMGGVPYIVTGDVDSCSQTITIEKDRAVQLQ